jgi:hypothetical protein
MNSSVPESGNTAKPRKSYLPASAITWPGATCSLHPEGSTDPGETIPVLADEDGIARFYAVRASAEEVTRRLSLDCHDEEGRVGNYPVDLDSDFTFQMHEPMVTPSSDSLRPALIGDPLQYSQSELLEGGYGLRPDPAENPDAYDRWLKAATRPLRWVKSKARELPVSFGPTSISQSPVGCTVCHPPTTTTKWSTDWGGPALLGNNTLGTILFTIVSAEIKVPTAIPGGDGTGNADAGLWAGLGGLSNDASDNPLIQSGVAIRTSPTAASYVAFLQYWPAQSNAWGLFNVNQGDTISVQAWACDASGNVSTTGEYGCFWAWDETTGRVQTCYSSASPSCPVHGSGGFKGDTAEFILEKPQGASYLPDYSCCATATGSAKDSQGAWHNFASDSIDVFQLYGFGTGHFEQLQLVQILSPNEVQFQFNDQSGGH